LTLRLMFVRSLTFCNGGPIMSGGMKLVTVKEGFSFSTKSQIAFSPTFLLTQ
jgi:hypothetical protein